MPQKPFQGQPSSDDKPELDELGEPKTSPKTWLYYIAAGAIITASLTTGLMSWIGYKTKPAGKNPNEALEETVDATTRKLAESLGRNQEVEIIVREKTDGVFNKWSTIIDKKSQQVQPAPDEWRARTGPKEPWKR